MNSRVTLTLEDYEKLKSPDFLQKQIDDLRAKVNELNEQLFYIKDGIKQMDEGIRKQIHENNLTNNNIQPTGISTPVPRIR